MITLRLPKELEHEIDRLARSEHQTRTEIIKQALKSYLARQKSRTPYELGTDLFGAGESGDHDLSSQYKVKLKENFVRSTLIDVGPLIALFSRNDKYHDRILKFLKGYKGRLVSTWPVITETCHMLDFDVRAQMAFLEWLNRGLLKSMKYSRTISIRSSN